MKGNLEVLFSSSYCILKHSEWTCSKDMHTDTLLRTHMRSCILACMSHSLDTLHTLCSYKPHRITMILHSAGGKTGSSITRWSGWSESHFSWHSATEADCLFAWKHKCLSAYSTSQQWFAVRVGREGSTYNHTDMLFVVLYVIIYFIHFNSIDLKRISLLNSLFSINVLFHLLCLIIQSKL